MRIIRIGYIKATSYSNLILVAGGIGISPFVAILRDLLHRIEQGQFGLPRKYIADLGSQKNPGSFVSRLVEIMAGIKTAQRIAGFWLQVVGELRRLWNEG
jgi:hypothetical protein